MESTSFTFLQRLSDVFQVSFSHSLLCAIFSASKRPMDYNATYDDKPAEKTATVTTVDAINIAS